MTHQMSTMDRDQLAKLSEQDVREPIPPGQVVTALTSPPFIPTQTLINLRDAGAVPGSQIRQRLVYRCGTLEVAAQDPPSCEWLSHTVRRIFDLRSPRERGIAPDPEVKDVENVWHESTSEDVPPNLEEFAIGQGELGVEKEYLRILEAYAPSFKAVLEHVRDRPGEPFLIHCTAGRDRTGVLAGLLQALAGTSPEDVCFDYMLSRIGTEPAREKLLQYARVGTGTKGVSSIDEIPGFLNLASLRAVCWEAFVAGLTRDHGGWEGYVTKALGFSQEDLEKIKANLK